MNKPIKRIFLAFALYLTIFLVTDTQVCLAAARDAINLCVEAVIPSLFPFFVCSGLLCSLGFSTLCSHFLSPVMRPLFNLPGAGALTLFMGILSGYPVGAATAVDLYKTGQCTKTETERMLAFCNNSGPMFVIGTVGIACIGNKIAGMYLYISHIIAAMIVGIIFRFYKPTPEYTRALPPYFSESKKAAFVSLGNIIDSSVFSVLKICGFVVFFSVFIKALPSSPYLHSLVEITGGIKALAQNKTAFTLPLISFFLALSGLSVLFQVYAIIQPLGLSVKSYILGKLLQGTLSFIITCVFLKIFPITQETFVNSPAPSLLSPVSSMMISLFTVFTLLCLMIPFALKKKTH